VVTRVGDIARLLTGLPHVEVNSALSVFRRAHAGFDATPDQIAAFRTFVTGTDLFRHQGLLGEHFLAIGLVLDVHGSDERRAVLAAVNGAIGEFVSSPAPLRGLHALGEPYVNAYLDETQRSAWRYFIGFAGFVVVLIVALYRSARTLLAFLVTLGACLAVSMGYIGATGGGPNPVPPHVAPCLLPA